MCLVLFLFCFFWFCFCFGLLPFSIFSGELVWAQVEEREATVANIQQMIQEKEGKLERNRATQAEAEAKLVSLESEEVRVANELMNAGTGSDDILGKLTELREELQNKEQEYEKQQRLVKSMPKRISVLEQRMEKLEKTLATEVANAVGGPNKEELKRLEQLKQLREQLGAAQAEFEAAAHEAGELRGALSRLNDEVAQHEHAERRLDKEGENLRNKLKMLTRPAQSQDPTPLWGAKMPDIVYLIERNSSKFRKTPIGPLGRCIKLVQETHTVRGGQSLNVVRSVESILGKLLANFWCDNYTDLHTLQRLISDSKLPPVKGIVYPFSDEQYSDIMLPPPSDQYVRVFDTFTCEPKSVLNVSMLNCC